MTKAELMLEQIRRYANNADMYIKLHSKEILSGYGNSELNCIDSIGRLNSPNAARIAEDMDITRSAVSKILRKLVSKDAAEAFQLPDNQKEIYYRLTPYGKEVFKQHRLRHQEWENRDEVFLETMDPATLEAAIRFMNAYNGFLEMKLSEMIEEGAFSDVSESGPDSDTNFES